MIDHYDDVWSHIGYVLMRGEAGILEPGKVAGSHAVELLRERYEQYRGMAQEEHLVISIQPEYVTAWGPALESPA